MNDYLNAIMALQLPFATIPTIAFSSSTGRFQIKFILHVQIILTLKTIYLIAIMGDFANGFWNKLISILLSITVIGINLAFIVSRIQLAHITGPWTILIGGNIYIFFLFKN